MGVIDTGKTADLDNPPDYSWRSKPGGGCLGSIHCEKCGCIMGMEGSSCFCLGIYTCPRCEFHKSAWWQDMDWSGTVMPTPVPHDTQARRDQLAESLRKSSK